MWQILGGPPTVISRPSMFCRLRCATVPAVEDRSYKRLGLEAAVAVAVALIVGALAAYVAAGGSLFVI